MQIVRTAIGFRGPAGALDMTTVTLATGAPGSSVTYDGGVLSIPRGDTGGQGATGAKGDPGEQGIPGIQGVQGDQGERGEQGLPGTPGLQGEQGLQGIQGNPGADGASVTVLAFEAADATGYDAAVAAYAGNPLVLVIRYGS